MMMDIDAQTPDEVKRGQYSKNEKRMVSQMIMKG